MIQQGLIEEVQQILKKYSNLATALQAIGYKEIKEYLDGKITKEAAIEKVKQKKKKKTKNKIKINKKIEKIKLLDELKDTQNNINIILEGMN